jgi:hypothetical protein
MTAAETHQAAQAQTGVAVATLMHWVADAQRAMDAGKLDGVARARLGELILNACRYLSELEADAKKAAASEAYQNSPGAVAMRQRLAGTQAR